MPEKKFYYDDPEGDALARETSHPEFLKVCTADFYYDCLDDFSPFGNDDGSDLLFNLEDWYREKKGKGNILKWLFKTIDEFGFTYASEGCSKALDVTTLNLLNGENPDFLRCMDNSILGAAFGQLKIAGQIDAGLKETALIALKRQAWLNSKSNTAPAKEYAERLTVMTNDLLKLK